MKWFKKHWLSFIDWWQGNNQNEKIIGYELVDIADQPDLENLKTLAVYYIGDKDWKWLLLFKCPCGCKENIQLSLLEKSKQSWYLELYENGRFSISPSIHRTTGCKSHFFIKESLIKWCVDE